MGFAAKRSPKKPASRILMLESVQAASKGAPGPMMQILERLVVAVEQRQDAGAHALALVGAGETVALPVGVERPLARE
ncbi:MAG: hypothetical protein QM820_42300 [Minicystis sp.]